MLSGDSWRWRRISERELAGEVELVTDTSDSMLIGGGASRGCITSDISWRWS